MTASSRRRFLGQAAGTMGAAAALAAMPPSIRRALAIPATRATGTVADVKHVVLLMQENRAFDHYLGTLRGVRGYSDRRAIRLPNGQLVWRQPGPAAGGVTLPFHIDSRRVNAQTIPDLDHSWQTQHQAWDSGAYDQWVAAKTDLTMAYYERADLPFHYALADAFTVCDAWYCSILGPTNPNRLMWMTGSIDPLGLAGGPVIDNSELGYSWITYPELLQHAGISWRVYQDPANNYDDNPLAWFTQFRNARPGSPLYDRGMSKHPLSSFIRDAQRGMLPKVSWIIGPAYFSEHPSYAPAAGAWYIDQVLSALTANPEIWAKTVLLVNYDENDGFFDHLVPPTPPIGDANGASTVGVVDEIYQQTAPYGLGYRVPMIVISPWSKGGFVCSQTFDHTSCLRFLELVCGVREPLIPAWRRAITGDLTSAFDFANPDTGIVPLPTTANYRAVIAEDAGKPGISPPVHGRPARQEPGARPARPLPYAFDVRATPDAAMGQLTLTFDNIGTAGAAFTAYAPDDATGPWQFAVEAGKTLSYVWPVASSGAYHLVVHGPNGFLRSFQGNLLGSTAGLTAMAKRSTRPGYLAVRVANAGSTDALIDLVDRAYGNPPIAFVAPAGSSYTALWPIANSWSWYDFVVLPARGSGFAWRFAGHIEDGNPSSSDPAM